jgi:hypothetical protein
MAIALPRHSDAAAIALRNAGICGVNVRFLTFSAQTSNA